MTSTPPGEAPQRFAHVAADAFERIYHRLAPARAAARDEAISAWLEGHEADAAALARQVLSDVALHPDMPAEAKPVFEMLLRPEHQTQAILTVLGVYPIVSAFVGAAVQPFVQDIANLAWSHHTSLPLSPAEAALALLRGAIPRDEALSEAAQWGVDSHRFDVLELNTGEPPGIGSLQEALRRGLIDAETFAHGVRQSRVRNEWIDLLVKLRYVPVGAGEVLAGAVQGHLDEADARHRISLAGVDPVNYEWLYETHGRPPGVVELGHLVNRGEMDEATWEQAVRESDIKNKYIPFLAKLHRQIMPMRTVVSSVRHAVLTPAEGEHKLRELGYNAADAHTLVSEASSSKTTHVKQLSEAQVLRLYADRLISKAQATVRLQALTFSPDEITLILELADYEHHARLQAAGISKVHAQYVAHKIDATAASTSLDKIGVDSEARADLLKVWAIERGATVHVLTLAQMQGLAHREVWKFETFIAHVVQLGYSKGDARLLYFLAFPPSDQPKHVPEV